MSVAYEHGLVDANGILAASLQHIVSLGGDNGGGNGNGNVSAVANENETAPVATTTTTTTTTTTANTTNISANNSNITTNIITGGTPGTGTGNNANGDANVNVNVNVNGYVVGQAFGLGAGEDLHHQQQQQQQLQSPHQVVVSGGFLNRGGGFPMRYGRHVYTGSARTLSSMSSIDEGDQIQCQGQQLQQHQVQQKHQPSINNMQMLLQQEHRYNQQQQQQPLRIAGRSSLTIPGSLSIIDGTDEEEMHSLNDSNSNSCNLPGCNGTATATVASTSTKTVTSPTTAVHSNDDDGHEALLVDRHLEKLRDSIQSSSTSLFPNKSIEAIESLLDFVASFFDPGATLDRFIEQGAVTVLVAAMGKYPKSSEIQAKCCEVLAVFAALYSDGNKGRHETANANENANTNINTNQSGIVARRRKLLEQTNGETGEAILFFSMILHEEKARVQEAALNAIQCLCQDCQENQTDFLKLDVIEPIIRAMENHRNEARLQEAGSSLVAILAGSNSNNNNNNGNGNPGHCNSSAKSAFGLNGGVTAILRAIVVHLDDAGVVETGCRALYELTLEDTHNVVVFLNTPGSTNAILTAMRSHAQNLAVQEMGCAILANLTTERNCVDLMITNGQATSTSTSTSASTVEGSPDKILGLAIETILEAIQGHAYSPTVQDLGCAALTNLTDSDETKMFVVDTGALDAIVLAMVLHKDNVRVQERICHLLLLLTVKENHRHILAANPIELVKAAAEKFPDQCMHPANRFIQELGL